MIVVTETTDPVEFANIALKHEWNTRNKPIKYNELKASSSVPKVCYDIVTDVLVLNPRIYARIHTKNPKAWKKGSDEYLELFRDAIDLAMRNTDTDELSVVIDHCSQLKDWTGVDAVIELAAYHKKTLIDVRQAASHDEYLLMVSDFVVYAIERAENMGDRSYMQNMKVITRRL